MKDSSSPRPRRLWVALCVLVACSLPLAAAGAEPNEDPPTLDSSLAREILELSGVRDGLCVHLGCGEGRLTAALFKSGRLLVHGIDRDGPAVTKARKLLDSHKLYGPVWVEQRSTRHLPYAENLVNLVVVDDPSRVDLSPPELRRVLCPGGVALIRADEDATGAAAATRMLRRQLHQTGFRDMKTVRGRQHWIKVTRTWPREMDEWSHPRHGPDGNAASSDLLVGPPRRVRWLAGPLFEVSNMVTANGRLFHAGLIGRDAFNGLRLWERGISPTPMRLGYPATAMDGSVLPVAAGNELFVFHQGKLLALDAATGETLRAFDESGAVREILHINGRLLAVGASSVTVLDARSGNRIWSRNSVDPGAVVAGDAAVFLMEGDPRRGGQRALVRLALEDGSLLWKNELPQARQIRRASYNNGLIVAEASTFNNDRPGNGIIVLSAETGRILWQKEFEPAMSHFMQPRAIHIDDVVWVLTGDRWLSFEGRTGVERRSLPAGTGHCYPPVATPRFLFAGEMGVTEIASGNMDLNPITKGFCNRDAGFLPAGGLIYCAPKHCSCWPMLPGYVALAPARSDTTQEEHKQQPLTRVEGPASGEMLGTDAADPGSWPTYRGDAWRSGSSETVIPPGLEVLWRTQPGSWPGSPFLPDWESHLFVPGPITAPVIAKGTVLVALPDRHRLVAFDSETGDLRWTYTTVGRVDGPPTIHGDICLFGTRSGWVECLRLQDGQLVWRLRAAPHEERIIAYSQLESPWPVPGSILVAEGMAYFSAGRHPLADGGVLVAAVDPLRGQVRWKRWIDRLPMKNFYAGAGLEFDGFDLLVAEGHRPDPSEEKTGAGKEGVRWITMSRWQFDPATGEHQVSPESGFSYHGQKAAGVLAPRGVWSYGPRMDYIPSGPPPGRPDYVRTRRRPLMVFRGDVLFGCTSDKRGLFRREFTQSEIEEFDDRWFNQRHIPRGNKPGDRSRSERLAHAAKWTADLFDGETKLSVPTPLSREGPPAETGVGALVLAGSRLYAAGAQGGLAVLSTDDGRKLAEYDLHPPVWDGMAAAYGRLYVSTRDGALLCLGQKGETGQ